MVTSLNALEKQIKRAASNTRSSVLRHTLSDTTSYFETQSIQPTLERVKPEPIDISVVPLNDTDDDTDVTIQPLPRLFTSSQPYSYSQLPVLEYGTQIDS